MRIVNIIRIRVAAVLLTLAMLQTTAAAHDFSTSYSRVTVHGEAVEVRLTLNLHDFHTADLAEAIEANYRLEAPEPPSSREIRSSNTIADNVVLLDLLYTFVHPVTSLRITSTFDRIAQADHSHIIQIGEGNNTREAILNAAHPSVETILGEKAFLETTWDFVKLGVEHIFTGYDHLAFLAGLLIMTTTLRALLKVVTSFTAAHSVTLALATFGLVSLPGRLIESLIALSIGYIAIENLTGKTLVHRWKITFLFGLIHGFGFSNVLKEMALSRRTLAIGLFSFNGGVELGQLGFVCVVFPIVLYLSASRWKPHFLFTSSAAIAALGFFWFIQRCFLTR
jgi:HupE / UreJ protein